MNTLNIDFEYCYGIKKLTKKFEFSNRTYAIYAPNGVMKTSFSKTLQDISAGKKPQDLVFPERNTKSEVFLDGHSINPQSIFVVESYNAQFTSEKIATLLANKQLKSEYEEIHKEIDKAQALLIKKLKERSGLSARKESIEKTLERIFKINFHQLLIQLEKEIIDGKSENLENISYQAIFNEKVISFLDTKDFASSLEKYIQKYDELMEKSPYLSKQFRIHNAVTVQKQLNANNFFKSGHTVSLFDGDKRVECLSDEELSAVIDDEKKKILSDDDLRNKFDEISEKLSNKELQEFRDYLLTNQEILPELVDLESLQNKLWKAYLIAEKDLVAGLLKKYRLGQEQIESLISRVREEKTDWEEVIRIFNYRFSHLPFEVKVTNREDVILKEEVEAIEFVFKDRDAAKSYGKKDDLLQVLSTGESRALYILNIIFEIEARKKEGLKTLLVVDDIADSFDYKNKYAIIDYLKSLSEVDGFLLLILTHNFDFFRTLESRKVTRYNQCLIAIKNEREVRLEKAEYLKNPFIKDWKNNLDDFRKFVASISFVRNLIEYTEGENHDDYEFLCNVLHYKEKSMEITCDSIVAVFNRYIKVEKIPIFSADAKIFDLIMEVADGCLIAEEGINLENKIVLSIASRLLADKFMVAKITDKSKINSVTGNQSGYLLTYYQEEYNNESRNIEILRRVNLITPENIHLNSFMYEPILDMGDIELRELYSAVKSELIA